MKQANESFAGPKNQKGFLNAEDNIRKLEETKQEIVRFATELDARLVNDEVDGIEYHLLLNEKLQGKSKEEVLGFIDHRIAAEKSMIFSRTSETDNKKKKAITFGAAAIILIFIAIIGMLYSSPGSLTGYTTAIKDVPEVIPYNQLFDHYTETQLDLTNLTSLKISGVLEGTGAKVKLRINGIDYTVTNIVNPAFAASPITGMVTENGTEATEQIYALTSDKSSYSLGETVTLTVTPDVENKSFYVITGEQTQKLDANTFITQSIGEHQAVAIIVLPNDMLRLEANFTVTEAVIGGTLGEPPTIINETNQTNQTNETNVTVIPEIPPDTPTGYQFTSLCLETCNLSQASNPILIVEPDGNSTLTISTIEVVQTRENQAPVQGKNIPDITLTPRQSATLDLNDYFSDPDKDVVQYDINNIPEINATINQDMLTISGETPGTYVAYIYATDGDKLSASNTFQIIINESSQAPATPVISNETLPANVTLGEAVDPCTNPSLNSRPFYCFEGMEDKVFQDVMAPLQNTRGELLGRFNRFGNLIIKGLLLQNYTGAPGDQDFRIGYAEQQDFEERMLYTAWISEDTGNLYLKGQLRQEQQTLLPPQSNVYSIKNKFGIVLGYFDVLTGDLYLKGNIVQLGQV